jgi:hypothetical protein
MGLEDSDIEKIVDAVKKSRTWKGFYDPKKAKSAFYAAFLVAYFGIAICGLGWGLTWSENEKISAFLDKNLEKDKINEKTFTDLESTVLHNADCESLFRIYQNYDSDMNQFVKSQIRDEISFRCN